jgi:hypothetical protein
MWASIIGALLSLFTPTTYGSELEAYITHHRPQNGADVERLQKEYDLQNTSRSFL